MNKKCICLICFTPNIEWFYFLSKFTTYDIYVIVDDNSIDYKEEYSNFSNINIIQINNEECKNNGFSNTCYITLRKQITGWSKAIYYFSSINTEYNFVWFLENDVFFNNEQTLINIDSKYNNSDLLSKSYKEKVSGEWLWSRIDIKISPPHYCAMVCCVRMTPLLLSKFKDYATEHNKLFFIEALFPSICKKYDLQYDTPSEFETIEYRKNYVDTDINENNLFHPVKELHKHIHYRHILNKK